MTKVIKKRNGKKVQFDISKILKAVERAYTAVEAEMPDSMRELLQDESNYDDCTTVEKVQNVLSEILFTYAPKNVYDKFISYRSDRAKQRKKKDLMSIVNIEINDITNDNANMNAKTPAGMMMKFAAETTKAFADEYFFSEDILDAMKSNYIYVHDKDYIWSGSLTCVQAPLDKLLTQGFRCGHGASRPAKRIETAAILAAISMETTQNEQHGGQAIPAFDFYMAPYVRMTYLEEIDKIAEICHLTDDVIEEYKNYQFTDYKPDTTEFYVNKAIERTISRVHQAMESFIHNMNTIHSRGGNQVVFSSINYGTDTSAEGRLIIREILKCTMQGVGNGSTAIFPIHVFKCKEGVNKNPGDPNYDLYKESWPVTARRFFPNYLNLDASYNKSEKWDANDPQRYYNEVATMGCRTRLWSNKFSDPTSIGRGNLSFTSINLPKLAIEIAIEDEFYVKTDNGYELTKDPEKYTDEAKQQRIDAYLKRLHKYADVVAKQLDDRYKFQSRVVKEQFPLLMSGVWMDSENLKPGDTIKDVIKHGSLGVSFIGLAETLIMLVGKHHGESDEAQKYGLEIIGYLNDLCKQYSDEYDHNYSCFATPAEGLSGRFTVIDRDEYGIIKDVTDKDFYTNSSHVPVWYQCTPQHKAEIEGPYHKLEPAGHIFYVEADADITKNPEVVDVINRIAWANDIGYSSINHNQARCKECNYETNDPVNFDMIEGGGAVCPMCGGDMSSLSRVTGYLSSTYEKQTFGKKAEILKRVVHTN